MIALKKVYGDELLRLALVLSLLRSDPNGYFAHEALQLTAGGLDASNGTWSAEHEPRAFTRPRFIHPKSPDNNLLEYEREVFAELNSLGGLRYAGVYGDLETYCVNNFVECRAAQVLQANVDNAPDGQDSSPNFGVSDDDNVAGEVHLANADDAASEAENIKEPNEESVKSSSNNDTLDGKDLYDESAETSPPVKQEIEPIPDVVTVTNVTDSTDLFDRLSLDVKEFDVSDFFATPSNMHIKKEEHANGVRVKVENEDLFETANNHFLPHYFERIKKYGEEEDVFDQNLSDLRDYAETVESLDDFRRGFERLDVKERGREDLERYLLDNTRIELDKYGGFAFELGVKRERASTSFTSVSPGGASETADLQGECDDGLCVGGEELTQEDMDLIEVLWKQDVDMGFSLDTPLVSNPVEDLKESSESVKPYIEHRDVPKGFKCGPESTACADPTETSLIPTTVNDDLTPAKQEPAPVDDPWAGFSYIIDTETGEYIIQGELPPSLVSDSGTDADRFDLLEEALQLVGLEEPSAGEGTAGAVEGAVDGDDDKQKQHPEAVKSELDEDRGAVMLHPGVGARPPHHPPHHHSHHPLHQHYHHQSIVRQMSMEQRWQDLASLLAITPPDSQHHLNHPHHLGHLNHAHQAYHPHHPHHGHHHAYAPVNHHPYAPQHGAAPPPHLPPSSGPYSNAYGSTLSVASPADKSDIYGPSLVEHQPPQAIAPAAGPYKAPATGGGGPNGPQHHEVAPATHPHDGAMYYQNSTSDINGTSDGFLSSILNDEDLQLMDMAVNEGMYTMRMLDGSGSQQLQSGVGAAGTAAPTPHAPHLHQYAPAHHGFANLAPNMAQAVAGATPVGATHLSMGNERMDSSSDSAVSSMGSERVPSLSDGEWCDGGSDSAQEYHSSKFRPYSSYGRTGPDGHPVSSAPASQAPPQRHHTPPVAQKKHHMFGKRCFQEQNSPILDPVAEMPRPREEVKYEYEPSHLTYGPPSQDIGGIAMPPELKYSCTLEFAATSRPDALVPNLPSLGVTHTERARIAHNHTYGAPPEHAGGPPLRPQARDKRTRRLTDGSDCSGSGSGSSASHLSRDEKRAKALGIPLAVQEIINLPMDEFNERLSKHDLSEAQLSLIRDIRRRGKNKVAAQNCRKRKLEQITSLEDEVRNVRDRKTRLQRERISLTAERQRVKDCFTMLYHHVFQHLRDTEGNPLSSHQYSLQQAADGAVVLVPRSQQGVPQSGAHSMHGAPHMLRQSGEDDRHGMNRTSEDEMDRYKPKHQRKSFDQ